MGENEHQKHPLVAPPTQSVDSKPRIRLKSNSTSTCELMKIMIVMKTPPCDEKFEVLLKFCHCDEVSSW